MNKDVETFWVDGHPLDIDLVDLVDGRLTGNDESAVRDHVEQCTTCRERISDIRPAIESLPADLDATGDTGLVDRFFEEPTEDPQPGELWRLEWADDAMLALVASVTGPVVTVLPVTVDVPESEAGPTVDADASPLGLPLFVWHTLRFDVPLGVLMQHDGSLPANALDPSDTTTPPSWEVGVAMADALGAVNRLAAATWIPAPDHESVDVAAAIRAAGVSPSRIQEVTGIQASIVTEYLRGRRVPTVEEARALGPVLGVDQAALHGQAQIPGALAWALERPVHRLKVRLRALRDGVTEAAARLSAAQDLMVRPARTTSGDRDMQAWDELIRQYLDA